MFGIASLVVASQTSVTKMLYMRSCAYRRGGCDTRSAENRHTQTRTWTVPSSKVGALVSIQPWCWWLNPRAHWRCQVAAGCGDHRHVSKLCDMSSSLQLYIGTDRLSPEDPALNLLHAWCFTSRNSCRAGFLSRTCTSRSDDRTTSSKKTYISHGTRGDSVVFFGGSVNLPLEAMCFCASNTSSKYVQATNLDENNVRADWT